VASPKIAPQTHCQGRLMVPFLLLWEWDFFLFWVFLVVLPISLGAFKKSLIEPDIAP
jgi:hypothetical protein